MEYLEKIKERISGGSEEFTKRLDAFVKALPERETELKETLNNKDYEGFDKLIKILCDVLDEIKAGDLAAECRVKLAEFKNNGDHSYIEAYINYFLATVSMLSIEVQMEIHKGKIRAADGGSGGGGSIKNILAVDDTTFFLSTLKSYIQDMPQYKLTCVTSGEEALRFVKKVTPDLFILDIEMPEMNGFELAEKLTEEGQSAPIVFLTANSAEKTVLRAIELGAADFIVKPTNRTQVISKISKFL